MDTDFTSKLSQQGRLFAFALILLWILVISSIGLRFWIITDNNSIEVKPENIILFDKIFFILVCVITGFISVIGFVVARLYTSLREAALRAEIEHSAAKRQKSDKIRLKRQLTNNINHELKTPICSILGYQEMILGNEDLDIATIRSFVKKSYDQAERLRRLMMDLSTITRIEEAAVMIERESVNLTNMVEELIDDILPQADNNNIEVVNKVTHSNYIINGNSMLVYSIFRNLVDNAIAYSGGRRVTIALTGEDSSHYHFSICDNGIGVEDKHLPHLFERFYRVDKGRSRKAGGTGLGLSIVKNAVLFHNGTIKAQRAKSGGLEFVFSLGKEAPVQEED